MFLCNVTAAIVVNAVKNNAYLCTHKSLLFINSVISEYLDYVNYVNMNNRDSDCEQRLGNIVPEKYPI